MRGRPFLEVLLVTAFLAGANMTAGFYIESRPVIWLGAFFLITFFVIAVVGGVSLRREMLRQRRYERNCRGLSWRP